MGGNPDNRFQRLTSKIEHEMGERGASRAVRICLDQIASHLMVFAGSGSEGVSFWQDVGRQIDGLAIFNPKLAEDIRVELCGISPIFSNLTRYEKVMLARRDGEDLPPLAESAFATF